MKKHLPPAGAFVLDKTGGKYHNKANENIPKEEMMCIN